MAFDLKKKFAEAGEADKKKAKEVTDKTVEEVKNKAGDLQESIKNFDSEKAKESALDMAKKGSEALKKHFNNAKETDKKVKEVLKANKRHEELIMPEDALKIIYFLIAADGELKEEEQEQFSLICKELDPEEKLDREKLIASCKEFIRPNDLEYLDYITDGIQDALNHSRTTGKGTIPKNMLLWDLLSVAWTDSDYAGSEKQVLRLISRRMEIDQTIILEMEAASEAIRAVLKEKTFLINSDRPYGEVAPRIEELDKRKKELMESVYQLIED